MTANVLLFDIEGAHCQPPEGRRLSKPKPKATFIPPPQAELKATPILEDVASVSATNKKRANRQTLRATYLTAPDAAPTGSGATTG